MLNEVRHTRFSAKLGVLRAEAEFHLVALTPIPANTPLLCIDGEIAENPTRHSVQIGHTAHIFIPEADDLLDILDNHYWLFMNHHCDPNSAVRGRTVISLREIHPGEEITFNYNTTEYLMSEPFTCRCGSKNCGGVIRGYSALSSEEQLRLTPWLADYLKVNPEESSQR